jgi:hypothetical protein
MMCRIQTEQRKPAVRVVEHVSGGEGGGGGERGLRQGQMDAAEHLPNSSARTGVLVHSQQGEDGVVGVCKDHVACSVTATQA